MLAVYTSADDFFTATREAAIDADRISKTLANMRSREGIKAQSYTPRTSGGITDVNQATDARIDYEERIKERRADDLALIDKACEVIYGRNVYTGGIAALLGSAYADCLWWRFCAAATWEDTAHGCGMSERWCRDAVRVAFDTVDAYGLDGVSEGLGLAEA